MSGGCLEMFFRGGGHPRGSAPAVADGSHAFVRVAVRSLTIPRGAPQLDHDGAGAPTMNEKEAGMQASQAMVARGMFPQGAGDAPERLKLLGQGRVPVE